MVTADMKQKLSLFLRSPLNTTSKIVTRRLVQAATSQIWFHPI